MTATVLGTITDLSEHLVLSGLESAPRVAYTARRLLGGRMHIAVGPTLVKGGQLTLSGENHATLAQVQAVEDLEAIGLPVTLVHHRGTFSVFISGVEATPAIDYADPKPEDWYSITINMIEV